MVIVSYLRWLMVVKYVVLFYCSGEEVWLCKVFRLLLIYFKSEIIGLIIVVYDIIKVECVM